MVGNRSHAHHDGTHDGSCAVISVAGLLSQRERAPVRSEIHGFTVPIDEPRELEIANVS